MCIPFLGKANMVPGSWIKPGAVVIDCGINSIDDSSKKSGYRLVGDVNYDEASKVAGFITPVPGGVGPMTVSYLMKNTVIAATRAWEHSALAQWDLKYLPLKPLAKVPSDIEVARAQVPKDVSVLADEIGK